MVCDDNDPDDHLKVCDDHDPDDQQKNCLGHDPDDHLQVCNDLPPGEGRRLEASQHYSWQLGAR